MPSVKGPALTLKEPMAKTDSTLAQVQADNAHLAAELTAAKARAAELESVLGSVQQEFRRHSGGFPDGFNSRVFRWVDDALAGAAVDVELVRPIRNDPASLAATPERFPTGLFTEGQQVKLRQPGEHRASFDNPAQPLVVVGKYWFRAFEDPTYALAERGGIGVVPFRDGDLTPA